MLFVAINSLEIHATVIYIDKFFKRRIDKNEERHNFQGSLTLAYRYASRGDVVPQDQMPCGKVNNLLYPFSKKR